MIQVTKPFLPPQKEYEQVLSEIWSSNWLTNHGPLLRELGQAICNYLNVPNCVITGNGTIALQIAYEALDLKGEVITTPFSYIATSSSLAWQKLTPVFVDIDPQTLNIDPAKVEELISSKTTAIVATHVFGNPCDHKSLEEIATRRNLKLIYDASHAFGVTENDQSILNWGDASTLSFHATKLYHMVEGGGIFTASESLNYRMEKMRNFGHKGPKEFECIGINGKNSEFHAAMGLCNIKYIDQIILDRKASYLYYQSLLSGTGLQFQKIAENVNYNFSYFPVVLQSEDQLEQVVTSLNASDIFPRRYFYPSLNKLEIFDNPKACPVAEDIARRILCLPLYYEIERNTIEEISEIIIGELQ